LLHVDGGIIVGAMIRLFWAITLLNWATLLSAAGLGYLHVWGRLPAAAAGAHVLAGAIASVVCVAVHCVVFTYFIATAKWAQHAVSLKNLDSHLLAGTQSFKAQAFPAALAAMATVFLAAIFGVLLDAGYAVPRNVHLALAWTALAVNLAAAAFEASAIGRNSKLIDVILAKINLT